MHGCSEWTFVGVANSLDSSLYTLHYTLRVCLYTAMPKRLAVSAQKTPLPMQYARRHRKKARSIFIIQVTRSMLCASRTVVRSVVIVIRRCCKQGPQKIVQECSTYSMQETNSSNRAINAQRDSGATQPASETSSLASTVRKEYRRADPAAPCLFPRIQAVSSHLAQTRHPDRTSSHRPRKRSGGDGVI
jgi:hypothetical protein